MKRFVFLFPLLLCAFLVKAQNEVMVQHSCNFDHEITNKTFSFLNPSRQAEEIVNNILNAIGLSKNFKLLASNCEMVLATKVDNQRFILYNPTFLDQYYQSQEGKWRVLAVLAHEIGHHLHGHDFSETGSQRRSIIELEADKFTGFVLYKLGARYEEIIKVTEWMNFMFISFDYPSKNSRIEAFTKGWEDASLRYKNNVTATEIPNNAELITTQSDMILSSQIAGYWQSNFYNTYGAYILNRVALYANGSLQIDTYMNGSLTSQTFGFWVIENGYFVEWNTQTQIVNKYKLDVFNSNIMSLTFTETNGTYNIPFGTEFKYERIDVSVNNETGNVENDGKQNINDVSSGMESFLKAKFPFPPPECHTAYEMPRRVFSKSENLGDVQRKISEALDAENYPHRFLSVPNGFAVVTQMEQYNSDGTIIEDSETRWVHYPKQEDFSWSIKYFNSLIFPKKGYLRMFIFIVTSEVYSSTDDVVSKDQAAGWHNQGVNKLPAQVANTPFSDDYTVNLLLYEFEVPESNHVAKQNCPCRFPAKEHLKLSGLKSSFFK